jgi:hypothetical protein
MTASMESVRREELKKTFHRGMLLALRTTARVPIKLVTSFLRAVTGAAKGEPRSFAAVEAAEREGFVAKAARAITDGSPVGQRLLGGWWAPSARAGSCQALAK